MGVFDSMLVKYGAVMVAYGVLGIPVFGSKKSVYLEGVSGDTSTITRDYIRNSSLLISLAKAIGRIVVSYKAVQNLAGYTTLVYELKEVIDDLKYGSYARIMSNKNETEKVQGVEVSRQHLNPLNQGEMTHDNDMIKLINVPLDAPNGDQLADPISCIVSYTHLISEFLTFNRSRKDTVYFSLDQTDAVKHHSIESSLSCGHSLEENSSLQILKICSSYLRSLIFRQEL